MHLYMKILSYSAHHRTTLFLYMSTLLVSGMITVEWNSQWLCSMRWGQMPGHLYHLIIRIIKEMSSTLLWALLCVFWVVIFLYYYVSSLVLSRYCNWAEELALSIPLTFIFVQTNKKPICWYTWHFQKYFFSFVKYAIKIIYSEW